MLKRSNIGQATRVNIYYARGLAYIGNYLEAAKVLQELGANESVCDLIDQLLAADRFIEANEIAVCLNIGLCHSSIQKQADALLEEGMICSAAEAYEIIGKCIPAEKLIKIAYRELMNGFPDLAIEAYNAAGVSLPIAEFIDCGNRLMDENQITMAIQAYHAVGHSILINRLLACGDRCFELAKQSSFNPKIVKDFLEVNWLKEAIAAYEEASDKSRLIDLGDWCFENGRPADGIYAYEAAVMPLPKTVIIRSANICLKQNNPVEAIIVLRHADLDIPLEQIEQSAKRCLDEDMLEQFLETYQLLGIVPPAGILIEYADGKITSGSPTAALTAYLHADAIPDSESLSACGDLCLEHGDLEHAKIAYMLANIDLPSEVLVEYGHKLLRNGELDKAFELYKAAAENTSCDSEDTRMSIN